MKLDSFGNLINVAVVGASGGIGGAFVEILSQHPSVESVLALSRSPRLFTHASIQNAAVDLNDPESIASAITRANEFAPFDLVIIASGLLHSETVQPEKTHRQLNFESMSDMFATNTIGPALLISGFLPLMRKKQKSVIAALSARVGSISDNRLGGWVSYRASKAALNMVVRTFAIEQARMNPDCVLATFQPGTVDTALSAPFSAGVKKEKLFSPDYAAGEMLDVIDGLKPSDSGGFFSWDGTSISY